MITFLFYNCISRFLGSNPIQEKVLYLKTFPCTFVWLSWLVRHNWAVISQIGLSLLSVRSCLLWATLNTLNISHFYNSRLVTKYVTQQMVRIVKILYLLIYYTSMPLMYPLRVGFFYFFFMNIQSNGQRNSGFPTFIFGNLCQKKIFGRNLITYFYTVFSYTK